MYYKIYTKITFDLMISLWLNASIFNWNEIFLNCYLGRICLLSSCSSIWRLMEKDNYKIYMQINSDSINSLWLNAPMKLKYSQLLPGQDMLVELVQLHMQANGKNNYKIYTQMIFDSINSLRLDAPIKMKYS